MYARRTNNGKRIAQCACSQCSKAAVGELCKTQRRINAEAVLGLIAEMLRAIAEHSKNGRAEFVKTVAEAQETQKNGDMSKKKKRLAAARKRAAGLEKLICKIYGDSIFGKLPEAQCAALDEPCAKEQGALPEEAAGHEAFTSACEKSRKSEGRLIALVEKYESFDALATPMPLELAEKILVHERCRKGSIQTTQEAEIFFSFVGKYVPPHFGEVNLAPEEQEEIRKREERKDSFRRNYLQRKASVAQKRHEGKTKAAKKAETGA
jgi:hypothetical protein